MSTIRPSPAGEALAVRRATWSPSLNEPLLSCLAHVEACSDTQVGSGLEGVDRQTPQSPVGV